ncbi:MAG: hypothetical protein HFJ72_01100 [Adlercreutzia sp.]|uniref:hypothetical protein n=1 Tax=uncultured Adlercreutzia sp. TaxID=875803 RepID=UPI0021729A41|nr:hypothetical protein [uncultured Adlercreutzia sp.]MCI8424250.1 hypothetical protein [Adlercreutzia sp.]
MDDVLGQLYANGAIDKAFERFFSLGLAGFVFVPLFGVLLIQPYHDLALVPVAVRCKSREEILFRYIAASLRRSAFFSFALCVSALPPLLMAGEIWQATISYTLLEFVELCGFFSVCALAFYLVSLLAKRAGLVAGFMIITIMGVWDFMSMNVAGGGLPYLGWSLALLQYPVSVYDAISSLSWFAFLACLMILGLSALIRRYDFVD